MIPAFKELLREGDMQIIAKVAPFADQLCTRFFRYIISFQTVLRNRSYHSIHFTDKETGGQKCLLSY